MNHLAYEVADAEIVRTRLRKAGYQENTLVPNAHPHRKRLYFYDPEGNEWEFVQYLSGDPARRNDYTLPEQ
ncbi:MAG: VOC family protein [Burkholderiales bacterium]|nr:VOC family protein [Burkholderiales bacterium]